MPRHSVGGRRVRTDPVLALPRRIGGGHGIRYGYGRGPVAAARAERCGRWRGIRARPGTARATRTAHGGRRCHHCIRCDRRGGRRRSEASSGCDRLSSAPGAVAEARSPSCEHHGGHWRQHQQQHGRLADQQACRHLSGTTRCDQRGGRPGGWVASPCGPRKGSGAACRERQRPPGPHTDATRCIDGRSLERATSRCLANIVLTRRFAAAGGRGWPDGTDGPAAVGSV